MTPLDQLAARVEVPLYEPNPMDRRSSAIEDVAGRLAWDRGGQTTPISSYDLDRAEELATGEANLRAENARLRSENAALRRALDAAGGGE